MLRPRALDAEHERDAEGDGLAGAGRGTTREVAPGEHVRDRGDLDRERRDDAPALERARQLMGARRERQRWWAQQGSSKGFVPGPSARAERVLTDPEGSVRSDRKNPDEPRDSTPCVRRRRAAHHRLRTRRPQEPAVLDRPPHPLCGQRHVDVAHAEVGQRVHDCVLHRRRRPDRAGLADALGSQLVERGRRLHRDQLEVGQLGGRRDRVVGEVATSPGCRPRRSGPPRTAPGPRPGRCPPWRCPSAMSGLRMPARVVDRDEPLQLHGARVRVHLHDRDVGAERERRARGRSRCRPGVPAGPAARRHVRPRAVDGRRAGHVESPGGGVHDDVGRIRLEQVGRQVATATQHLAPTPGTPLDPRPAASASPPVPSPDGVSSVSPCTRLDVVEADAESVGDDHGERRGMALAVGERAGPDAWPCRRVVTSTLPNSAARHRVRDLDVDRQSDAQQPRVAALAARAPAPRAARRSRPAQGPDRAPPRTSAAVVGARRSAS